MEVTKDFEAPKHPRSDDEHLSFNEPECEAEEDSSKGDDNSSVSEESLNDPETESNTDVRERYYETVKFHKYKIESKILRRVVKSLKTNSKANRTESYFAQGNISSDDVSVNVTGIGCIAFPIKYETATKLIDMAMLAPFGHGEQTKQDPNVRDTYMISKGKLSVNIKSLENTLKDIKMALGLNENSNLEVHLHNMLIYKQDQHFDYHQDTEKMNNMVATLVVALPSAHIGGDLIIKHMKKSHVFSTEMIYGNYVKYIAFYSDCHHKVEKVKEGFRIVLTYNLILCDSQFKINISCNPKLVKALDKYFKNEQECYGDRKLIYLFDHYYTKSVIKFTNLKGFDSQTASELLCAARKLNLVASVALADVQEVWDGENGDLVEMDITLESWRDENNQPLDYKNYTASQHDVCWLKHNNKMEPYNVENSGYTGNEGITEERWYKRAAMVLWPQSSDLLMQFELNYNGEVNKLKTLMESPNNLSTVQDIVRKADKNLYRGLKSLRSDNEYVKTFVKLAIYMKNSEEALKICQHFCCDLFDCENYNLYLQLKDAYGSPWCLQLMSDSGISKNAYSNRLVKFISVLNENDRTMIEQILSDQIPKAGDCYNKNEQLDRYSALVRAAYQTKCVDYVKDIFKAVVCREWDVQKLAQFYIQNCMDIQQDIVEMLKERVVTLLKENISKYKEIHNKQMQWLSKVNFGNCKCELCEDMINFLKKGRKVKEFAIIKQKRRHLLNCFEERNRTLFSMTTKEKGSPYRLVVEKKIDVINGVEGVLAELEKLLKRVREAGAGDDETFKTVPAKRSTQEDVTETEVKKQCL
ncbi:hypothetical protein EVAR_50102_1 [Eumeta japonica]|uniref:Prolyl 4-hydroxylase alpha subunit Fe(2+) 2OG dioxygenase domain-containing protein n=1 Tax=Eumeta variegata TaxID=151549 RepID=A0A4C1XUL1_EUMVA|nr:hypothetical protein EVAR_50102_1 [Eumeta japonica]